MVTNIPGDSMETAPEKLSISFATNGELQIAAEMRQEMAVEAGESWDGNYPTWREKYVSYFSAKQDADEAKVILAKSGTKIIGMISVSVIDDYHLHVRNKKSGRVNAVYVRPEYRRKGVASEMMQVGLQWMKEKGCLTARLHSSEQGVFLYSTLGFKPRNEMELLL